MYRDWESKMISSYLQLDKAKHGERIKALYDDYNRLNRLIYEMGVERDAIEFTLKNRYLKDTENLHSKITKVLCTTLKNWLMTLCLIGIVKQR